MWLNVNPAAESVNHLEASREERANDTRAWIGSLFAGPFDVMKSLERGPPPIARE
jgi:hypothetical protein